MLNYTYSFKLFLKKEKGLKSESQKTVISLINILEINNCKPVLARNYENFPNFSNDLDLFVENNREIIIIFALLPKIYLGTI